MKNLPLKLYFRIGNASNTNKLDKRTDFPTERDINISCREVVDCTCVVWPTEERVGGDGGRSEENTQLIDNGQIALGVVALPS